MDHIDDYQRFKHLPYWTQLQAGMRNDLVAYLERGVVPTGALYAILTNDLKLLMQSDLIGTLHMDEMMNWHELVDQEMPMASVGSTIKVQAYARNIRHQLESRI